MLSPWGLDNHTFKDVSFWSRLCELSQAVLSFTKVKNEIEMLQYNSEGSTLSRKLAVAI